MCTKCGVVPGKEPRLSWSVPGKEPRLSWSGLVSTHLRIGGYLKSAITENTVNLLTNTYTRNGVRSCDPTPEEGGLLGSTEMVGSKLLPAAGC